ncbi:hypothetical protein IGI04_039653 [Brassica rapa subsp. trilocularis]|uniref:IBB domain-containing protein n=1 Tax=Brassica rapa subsp. trilocularis TaxID=1813537 RepID=A0ABQ7KM75_BRACM|nr:hypothetical protein IGI04_039653 [Brassica rapa subsp. trilocularis]
MNTGQDEEPLPSTGTRKDATELRRRRRRTTEETNLQKDSNRRAHTGGSTNRRKSVDAYNRSYLFNYLACEDPASL